MLDAVLKKLSAPARISVKGAIAVVLAALAVGLPQIAHIVGGAAAGSVWMPMYLPVLLAGCLLGWHWGLLVGVLSPIVSFGFTTLALNSAMPALERLPYMTLELAAFGAVSGAFTGLMKKSVLFAFPAVLAAQVAGRAVYVVYNLIAGKSFASLMSSVQTGLVGLYARLIIVPLVVIAVYAIIKRADRE